MTIKVREYKNKLTLDGRVKPVVGVSESKVKAVRDLLEKHYEGNRIATATLHEALTTSDAIFNLAHLATLNFVPNYDIADRTWTQIAGTREAPDFRPITLYSLSRSWTDGTDADQVLAPQSVGHNAAPIVPEGTAYPYAYISGEATQGAGVVKRGFKTDWTLESRINDSLGAIERLPAEMLSVSLDTEEADVYGALISQTPAGSALAGGVTPEGATVLPNAAFSRDAIIRAMIELANRTVNGRMIGSVGSYNLIVPIGQALFVNFILQQNLNKITKDPNSALGTAKTEFEFQVAGGYNPLSGVSVVESPYVTGSAWYLLPKPGATRRPVLERLTLRGYTSPQLFVDNHVGTYVGGASVSPFEGSFDADVITLKLRQFGGGVVWDNGAGVIKSTGLGVV